MASSTTLLFSLITIISNLILPSLSGGCRYANFETSGVVSYGPLLIDPSICPTFDIAVGGEYFNFRCEEPAPGFDPVPSFRAYSNPSCSNFIYDGIGLPGDCTLPETGCNIYKVDLTIIGGSTNCGIIQPDDDCDPTCDIGFPEVVGTISMIVTDGGSNQCQRIGTGESVKYSDISVENGFIVEVFNNEDCSGNSLYSIDYRPGCRSDDVIIEIELIDAAETTTSASPTEEPTEEPNCIWSEWYDRDDPTFTGDWETIDTFAGDGTIICNGVTPVDIDCESLSGVDYDDFVFSNAVQSTTCDASFGFQCLNSQSQSSYPTDCPDFRVRFCCAEEP